MMKVLICYFSGTGNTKKVVDEYVWQFQKNNCEVDVHKVEDAVFDKDPNDYDLIGIAYPIHAFNAPPIMVEFVKKLPKLDKPKRLFIIKTSGEPLKINNISSIKVKKYFNKKNYILNNEYHYIMPYNMIFRHSDAMAYQMWNTASQLIPIDCKEIILGEKVTLKNFFMGSFLAWIFRIEHWGGRFNGKKYKVSDKCIHCQKCIKNCPVNNISLKDGKFVFGNKCIMCMRCSFMCPTNAIKIGWLNGWKVNGEYNFNNPNDTTQQTHKNFCKKAYKKYFERSQQKILKYASQEGQYNKEY